ncbi:helix-turn-helix transcriptional regulator [Exilibacterium tricleocarpae]|uniref:Helix-turn-helix transcriptional regulator n=1 Tax=Exilibacterium tricleocarpae TaxID=2591008 RepID=A0A545T013_9GAMM|nr:metalloregulator ArsR/SmtB family transcription factor [Exilibacterium tricleocarpae]TQV70564.1 helix-turn-helix transcriptional regulator [Exilibacterium tricleocarpae]
MAIHYQTTLDRTFHALGDGTRREILSTLATQGACSAGELCAPFAAAQPTISKHLKVLELAGLVRREVKGRTHRFELVTTPMDEAGDWISRHQQFWEGTLERLEAFLGHNDSSRADTEDGK